MHFCLMNEVTDGENSQEQHPHLKEMTLISNLA